MARSQLLFCVAVTLLASQASGNVVPDEEQQVLFRNDTRIGPGFLYCACSPTDRGYPPTALINVRSALIKLHRKIAGNATQQSILQLARSEFGKCVERSSYESCINADVQARKTFTRSMCAHDIATGKNVAENKPDKDTLFTLGLCSSSEKYRAAIRPINEGCVAVEHLIGYPLLHARNLQRKVLCAHGFCATPNHAIIVDGRFTSMRRMCAADGPWECTEKETLVNNIKVWRHRRVRVSDLVTITPYDYRFPRWVVWVAQFVHEFSPSILALFVTIMLSYVVKRYNKQKCKV